MATILVIDDLEVVRRSIGAVLVCAGHDVVGVPSVPKALTQLKRRPFDLVVTDIVMPDMDGLEAILAIRRMDKKLAILAMSGGGRYLDTSWLEIAKEFGANGVLEKPFSLNDLTSTVASLVATPEATLSDRRRFSQPG